MSRKVVDVYVRLKAQGMGVDDYLGQTSFFGNELDPFQSALLKVVADNARSSRSIRNMMDEYANIVEQQAPAGQMAMFENVKKTKGQILDEAAATATKSETNFAGTEVPGTQLAGTQPEGVGGVGEAPPVTPESTARDAIATAEHKADILDYIDKELKAKAPYSDKTT